MKSIALSFFLLLSASSLRTMESPFYQAISNYYDQIKRETITSTEWNAMLNASTQEQALRRSFMWYFDIHTKLTVNLKLNVRVPELKRLLIDPITSDQALSPEQILKQCTQVLVRNTLETKPYLHPATEHLLIIATSSYAEYIDFREQTIQQYQSHQRLSQRSSAVPA